MKTVFFVVGLIATNSAFACGSSGGNFLDIALVSSFFTVYLCSLIIPVSGMLMSKTISKREISWLAAVTFAGLGASIGFVLGDHASKTSTALGIVLASITMSTPTALYLKKAVIHNKQIKTHT